MSFPGSGPLLRYAGKQLGQRVVREFGLPDAVGQALGVAPEDAPEGPRRARPLLHLDATTERAVGERAFQSALSYLGDGSWSAAQQSKLAQAIAHAVVDALDEYLSRTVRQPLQLPDPGASGPAEDHHLPGGM